MGLIDGNSSRAINETTFNNIKNCLDNIELSEHEDPNYANKIETQYRNFISRGVGEDEATREIAKNESAPLGIICVYCSNFKVNEDAPIASTPDWSWQDTAIYQTTEAIRVNPGSNLGLVVPTGGGKTVIASKVLFERLKKDPELKCLWVAHRHFLLEQVDAPFPGF